MEKIMTRFRRLFMSMSKNDFFNKNTEIRIQPTVHYAIIDDVIVVASFRDMYYYFLDETSTEFFRTIMHCEKKLYGCILESLLPKFEEEVKSVIIKDFTEWCYHMRDKNILKIT